MSLPGKGESTKVPLGVRQLHCGAEARGEWS